MSPNEVNEPTTALDAVDATPSAPPIRGVYAVPRLVRVSLAETEGTTVGVGPDGGAFAS